MGVSFKTQQQFLLLDRRPELPHRKLSENKFLRKGSRGERQELRHDRRTGKSRSERACWTGDGTVRISVACDRQDAPHMTSRSENIFKSSPRRRHSSRILGKIVVQCGGTSFVVHVSHLLPTIATYGIVPLANVLTTSRYQSSRF